MKKEIQIKAKTEDLKGSYSNLLKISHTKEEFVLDFCIVGSSEGVMVSRVILSPDHLKRVVHALQENMSKYEERFGGDGATDKSGKKMGFQS